MSLNGLFKFMLISIWLATMGWLIRFEAFPYLFDPTLQGYREMSKHLPALRDSWMKVVAEGKHVGYINSSIEMMEVNGEEQLQMSTQLLIRILFQGRFELVRLNNVVKLDAQQNLVGSDSTFSMGTYNGSLNLKPMADSDNFIMTLQFNEVQFKRQIKMPDGVVIASPLMDTGLRSVKVGRTVKIRSMDPFSPSGELSTLEITGVSVEERQLPGEARPVKITHVSMRLGDWVMAAEVDEYGRIIRQETPFGLTFVKSEASEAMKIPQNEAFDPMTLISSATLPSFINLPANL